MCKFKVTLNRSFRKKIYIKGSGNIQHFNSCTLTELTGLKSDCLKKIALKTISNCSILTNDVSITNFVAIFMLYIVSDSFLYAIECNHCY